MNQQVIYLASGSPRRRDLLRQIGVPHETCPADLDESVHPGEPPADYVKRLSREKAMAAQKRLNLFDQIFLGADTTVVIDQEILGKPENRAHGLELLGKLSGKTHEVYTGVTVIRGHEVHTGMSVTGVTMRELALWEMEAYWADGEPADKAGAYGVQGVGGMFVKRIEGSYSGVMGLPLCETSELLVRLGYRFFDAGSDSP